MDVEVQQEMDKIEITFLLGDDDGYYNKNIKMDNTSMYVEINENMNIEIIHPDHMALAILLVANPFIGSVIQIPFAVSEKFKEATKIITKYNIIFVDGEVQPYSPTGKTRPGLSFSGGADSTAALLLMPETTLAVFMDRPLKEKASLYNKSAAYATIKHANAIGHDVRIVGCNLEYLRSPIGFPSDLAPSVPLILMAAKNNVDSIAFGTVLESAYRVGHESCREYTTSGHYRVWGGIFSAAGIPLYLPVSGISEVGTSLIVQSSSFKKYTRSCIRGCEKCWKCFRKNLVEKRLLNQPLGDIEMKEWLSVREVQYKLKAWPISHENVLAWSLQGSNSTGSIQQILLNRTEGSIRDMAFLERWYSLSIELIPPEYQINTEREILKFLKPMKSNEVNQITTHNMTDWLNSLDAKKSQEIFLQLLNSPSDY